MNRTDVLAVMSALVVCVAGVGVAGAADDLGQSVPQYQAPATLKPPVAPTNSAAKQERSGPSMSLQGEIVLRNEDRQTGVLYLRVKDADGRVWVLSAASATAVTKDGMNVSMDLLKEGARVEASFPRGGENVPVASSIAVLQPALAGLSNHRK